MGLKLSGAFTLNVMEQGGYSLNFFDELNITLDSLKEKLGSEAASDIKHLIDLLIEEATNPDKKTWFPEYP